MLPAPRAAAAARGSPGPGRGGAGGTGRGAGGAGRCRSPAAGAGRRLIGAVRGREGAAAAGGGGRRMGGRAGFFEVGAGGRGAAGRGAARAGRGGTGVPERCPGAAGSLRAAGRRGSAGRGMFWAPGGPAWGTTEPGPVGLRGAQPRGAGAPGSPCTLPVRSDMHLGGRGAAYINSRTNSAGIVLANALKSYPERLVRAYRWQSETVPQVYGSLSPAQDSPNVECVSLPPRAKYKNAVTTTLTESKKNQTAFVVTYLDLKVQMLLFKALKAFWMSLMLLQIKLPLALVGVW